MNILQGIILGVVEGVTEFLPISSTGHLMLFASRLGLDKTEFLKSFEIAIQLGAILAIAALYWKTLARGLEIWKRVLTAFFPTACIGLIFYKIVKKFLLANNTLVLWSFFIGGILLVAFEMLYREKNGTLEEIPAISYWQALCIGLFQSVSIIPGVSRAAATIIGGLALGLKRRTIVEFSFFLAIPTILAATTLDLARSAYAFSQEQFLILGAGFLTAFFVAMIAVKFLLAFIKQHNFIAFGIYRIAAALLFWFMPK